MTSLLPILLLTFVTFSYSCAPPAPEAAATTAASGRKRRSIEPVEITLVTHLPFNPSTNDQSLLSVNQAIQQFQQTHHISYQLSKVHKEVVNQAGQFAVVYDVQEDCQTTRNFVKEAKQANPSVAYVLIQCPGDDIELA